MQAQGAEIVKEGVDWRSLIDNLFIETVASVFIDVSAVVYGHLGYELLEHGGGGVFMQPQFQLVPAVVCGLVILTCRDESYMPPDATPTVTVLLWCLGAYTTWMEAGARMLGHCIGFVITLLVCWDMGLVPQTMVFERPGAVVFGSEALATCIEHMSLVYLLLPLMPTRFDASAAKTVVTGNVAALAALSFAVTHWCLRVTFASEMNPTVMLLRGVLGSARPQPHYPEHGVWHECMMAIWGQCVGMLVCIVYCRANMPKVARANFGTHAAKPPSSSGAAPLPRRLHSAISRL